jgi:hypothetical protein
MAIEELTDEVRAVRAARVARLTASSGWLAIINKTWLGEGTHTIGSAPGSDILLPQDRAPARLGTVTRTAGEVRFDAPSSVDARARGAPVASVVLRSDAESEPDQVAVGSLRLELIRRGDDVAIRVRDTDSAAARSFAGIRYFDIDTAARVVARFEPATPPRDLELADSDGRNQTFVSPGTAVFELAGVSCRLSLLLDGGGRRLFVLFADATNRDESYGAGRFLYAALPVDGRVVLDFNQAFNPPCAFTPYASCPLPSAENRLAVRIAAGEKRPDSARG